MKISIVLTLILITVDEILAAPVSSKFMKKQYNSLPKYSHVNRNPNCYAQSSYQNPSCYNSNPSPGVTTLPSGVPNLSKSLPGVPSVPSVPLPAPTLPVIIPEQLPELPALPNLSGLPTLPELPLSG